MTVPLRLLLVGLLSVALVGLPMLPDAPLRPFQVDERRVDLAFASDGGGAWISAPVEGGATIAGLTWADAEDEPESAEVRVEIDGEWTDWEVVPVDDEHAPDPGTGEAADARGGTSPIVVDGANAVQFRITDATTPEDLVADLVSIDDPDAGRRVQERPGAAEAAVRAPTIHPRSAWGGETCPGPNRDPIEYGEKLSTLFVHHTTGHTSYEQSKVPSIILGICRYHVNGRGWSDIGYNALIDRYGGIWVGRDGGIDKHVIGAHTGGFNGTGTGVALIGDHEVAGAPTTAAQSALVRYTAWKLDLHGVTPMGKTTVTSAGSTKYPKGTTVSLDNISGHRDASLTSCPGKSCYALMGEFRKRVDAIAAFEDVPKSHTFHDDIEWLAEWGITRGCNPPANTRFCPTGSVTRGEMAAFLVRALKLPAAADAGFTDVAPSHVFHDDINRLAAAGITRGCNPPTNDRFCPEGKVKRDEMAAFLVRGYGLTSLTHPGFSDVPITSTFALDIRRLAAADVTRGCNPPTNSLYCPTDQVTRAQMAAFIRRATTS